eukprot:INCI5135.21.p1 GENE.INCI5135.21~~INCI5135.21.p1  ORF type:complete len:224 (-),score=36.88 INCI5135.21:403-1074(-)
MSKEYFYQRAIRNFSHFPRIVLQPPASLTRLLEVAFATAEIHNPTGDDSVNADASTSDDSEAQKAKQASQIKEAVELLVSKADMLDEYFQISITPAGLVESLPQLEPEVEYTPQLDGLPRFIYNMAYKVDWCSEQMCFRDVAEELAFLYSLLPVRQLKRSTSGSDGAAEDFEETLNPKAKLLLSQVLFPAFRSHLLPPAQWLNTHVFMEVACLQKLYRIFERC